MGRPRRSRRFAGAEVDEPAPRARPDNPGHNPGPGGMTRLGEGPTVVHRRDSLVAAHLMEAADHVQKADEILERVSRAIPGRHWPGEIDRLRVELRTVQQEILTDAELLEAEEE